MAHDVFLSYSSSDKAVADAACARLEANQISCWIAPRDVLPGASYGEALTDAITASRVVVLVFSSRSNTSPQVMREVERAVSKGIPILPFKIEEVKPSKAMEYFISSHHWLDATTPPLEKHLARLGDSVAQLLGPSSREMAPTTQGEPTARAPNAATVAQLLEEVPSGAGRRRQLDDQKDTEPGNGGQEQEGTRSLWPMRPWVWGLVCLCVLGGFGALLAHLKPAHSYALDWAVRDGRLVLLNEIAESRQRQRAESYRLEQSRGRVTRIERVNGRGALLALPPDLPFDPAASRLSPTPDIVALVPQYDDAGAFLGFQQEDRSGGIAGRIRYAEGGKKIWFRDRSDRPAKRGDSDVVGEYRELNPAGLAIERRFVDAFGVPRRAASGIYGVRTEFDRAGLPSRMSFLDAEGRPASLRNGEAIHTFVRDANGEPIREQAFDAEGKPTVGVEGYHRVEYRLDTAGNQVETTAFDADDKPAPDRSGTARSRTEYRGGVAVALSRFDHADKPAPGMDGHARLTLEYDSNGYESSRRFFDTKGQPTANREGAARIDTENDDKGAILFERYFGRDGAPAENNDGYAAAHYERDSRGRLISTKLLDRRGSPVFHKKGYAETRIEWTDENQQRSWGAYDEQGNRSWYNGYSSLHNEYDERGHQVEESYHAPDGSLVFRADLGCAVVRSRYDARGSRTTRSCLGLHREPVRGSDGAARYEFQHDALGNLTVVSRLDELDHPVLGKDGVARTVNRYDSVGRLRYLEWYGTRGEPVYNVGERVSKIEFENDAKGRVTRKIHLDAAGKPTFCTHGGASVVSEYDDLGNLVQATWLGLDGKPIATRGAFAIWRARYDPRGHQSRFEHFDAKGMPTADLREGIARLDNDFDEQGNYVAVEYRGIHGEPVLSKLTGCVRFESTFDDHGNDTEKRCLDAQGGPRPFATSGVPITQTDYSPQGAIIEIRRLDGQRRPTKGLDGIARAIRKLDARSQVIEESYFDVDGRPAAIRNGAARRTKQFDEHGRVAVARNYDASGKPTEGGSIPFEERFDYDWAGRRIRYERLGPDGKLIIDPDTGWARMTTTYDAAGRLVEETYSGADGKLVATREGGYARISLEYDARGLETARRYFDANGAPSLAKEGFASNASVYDEFGRLIQRTLFDQHGAPVLSPFGYARRTVKYTDRGQPAEQEYFGSDFRLRRNALGFAREMRKYDQRGMLERIDHQDEAGKPTDAGGFATIQIQSDAAGVQETQKLFDAKGRVKKGAFAALLDEGADKLIPQAKTGARAAVVVAALEPDSAAARAGLRAGDVLLDIDGRSVTAADIKTGAIQVQGANSHAVHFYRWQTLRAIEQLAALEGELDARVAVAPVVLLR